MKALTLLLDDHAGLKALALLPEVCGPSSLELDESFDPAAQLDEGCQL
jgi:hypothetical protein